MFFKDQAWKEKNGDNSKHFPLKVKKGTNLYLKLSSIINLICLVDLSAKW